MVYGGLYIALLLDLGFLYIIELPSIIQNYRFIWISLIGFATAYLVIIRFRRMTGKYLSFINKYSVLLLISLLTVMLYTVIAYPRQGIIDTILSMQYFLVFSLVYAFMYYFLAKGMDQFMLSIHWIVIPWEILLIINSSLYAATGGQILRFFAEDNVAVRIGVRIALYVLAHVLLIYDFNLVVNGRKSPVGKRLAIINLTLGTYCLLLVEQTRAQTLAIFAAWFIVLISDCRKKRTMPLRIVILVAAYFLLFESGYLQEIFNSLTGGSEVYGEYGQQARFNSMEYFWNCFLENPLCGIGFVRYGGAYDTVVRGPSLRNYANDVGIVGLIGTIGIFAFLLYGALLIRCIYDLVKMFQHKSGQRFFACALFVYILATTPSLIMFGSNTCLLFPLSMAIFEYGRVKSMEGEENSAR